jgi:hypothetical protein
MVDDDVHQQHAETLGGAASGTQQALCL